MVTTKKGGKKGSAPQITYGFQYGFKTKTPDRYRMMNFDEKLQYERDLGFTNQYLKPLLKADNINGIAQAPNPNLYWDKLRANETDWMKTLLRTGKLMQHDLSVNGSSEKIDYFFSMQSYDEDGISYGSNFNRKSGNLGLDFRLNDWIKVGQNISVSYSKSRLLRDINNVQSPFTAMYTYNPYESPYDFTLSGLNGYNLTSQGFNIVEAIQNNPSFSGKLYGLSSTYLELTPIKSLTFRSQLGLQYTQFTQENFTQPGSILDLVLNGNPTGNKTDLGTNTFNYVWSNTAQYRKTFNDVHSITLLVGTEFTKENTKNFSFSSKGYYYPDLNTQNNGATPVTATTSRTSWALMSYFGRVQLRNLSLAYNLPRSFVSKAKIQALKVYVQGQNLWYSAPGFKGDPEVGISSRESAVAGTPPGNAAYYSYPQTKAITFGRGTVKSSYDKIVADLLQAAPLIKANNGVGRLNKAAVYGLLSRVFLYGGEWTNCAAASDSCLSINSDPASIADFPSIWTDKTEKGVIFKIKIVELDNIKIGVGYSQTTSAGVKSEWVCSYSLAKMYDTLDVRNKAYILKAKFNGVEYNAINKYIGRGSGSPGGLVDLKYLRVAEILLNRAEAKSMLGMDGDALTNLNTLRQNRYKGFTAGTETGQTLNDAIAKERRLEMAFESDRWFELKRKGLPVKRDDFGDLADGTGTKYFVRDLPASDNRWQIPLSQGAVNANTNLIQNPGF
jgi:hypothetical protein